MVSDTEASEYTSDSSEGERYGTSLGVGTSCLEISPRESTRVLGGSSVSELSIDVDAISKSDLEIVTSILNECSEDNVVKSVQECIYELIDAIDNGIPNKSKKLRRKRTIKKKQWVNEKRKRAHQEGKAYINCKKQFIPAKRIKDIKRLQQIMQV